MGNGWKDGRRNILWLRHNRCCGEGAWIQVGVSDVPSLDYDRFVRLQELDLCHYMEPLLADRGTMIPEDVLREEKGSGYFILIWLR